MMEEKQMTEKESLELISQMIRQTKDRLAIGSGNLLLVWGYVCVAVSLLVYGLVMYTCDARMCILYFLVPVLGACLQGYVLKRMQRKYGNAENFTTRIVNKVWGVVGIVFIIATVVCAYFFVMAHTTTWVAMFVLGLLAPGFGCTVTGYVLRESSMVVGGYMGIALGVAMLCTVLSDSVLPAAWCLAFAASYVLMMVVPGHYLNRKARRQNLKKCER